jgi:hypothetical protein
LYEELDEMRDRLTISLANTAVADRNSYPYIVITVYPMNNFVSMAAVPYFEGWTGDESFNPIESFTGASY